MKGNEKMKKLMFFVLAVVMIATFAISASAVDYGTVEINKVTTAPTVDGAVGTNEYPTVIEYDATKSYWNYDSDADAANYDVVLYMGWDETYLYTALTAKATTARTYDNADWISVAPYIFDRRHVMSAVITGNPTDTKYQPANGTDWEWGAANSSGYGNEWAISAQPDGTNISNSWFSTVAAHKDFSYKVTVSSNGTEVYEQKIPWAAFVGGTIEAKEGTLFGYSIAFACEEVAEGVDSVFANFGAGINGHKNFAEYVGLTLAGEKAPETVPETSVPATEDDTTPPETGDGIVFFAVLALVSLAGAAVVAKKRA